MTISEFFAMGGYGAYIWPAYGVTLAALIINALVPVYWHRRLLREFRQSHQRQQQLQRKNHDI